MPTNLKPDAMSQANAQDWSEFIANMPKAELHLHIEGTLDLAQRRAFANRNGLPVPVTDEATAAGGYNYDSLEEFLAIYYQGMDVLCCEQDFYDLTAQFLRRCHDENIIYVEISFDPQPHLARGVPIEVFMGGITEARNDARNNLGVESNLIMCVNRDRPLEEAWPLFDLIGPWRDQIVGFGLDSAEHGNPPRKYQALFERARAEGYRLTAHCDVDQENSIEHIRECLELLRLERIDHGVNAIEDPAVIKELLDRKTCLTVCPTWRPSDQQPRRIRRLRQLFDAGVRVTVNTDDPALFPSGYLTNMLVAVQQHGHFTRTELATLTRNAFLGSFATDTEISAMTTKLDEYMALAGSSELNADS